MDNSLEISLNQKILTLTLNRPDRLNGFTETMSKSLLDQIIKASNDDTIRVIVLTGAGTIFSSGMDLDGLLADGFDAVDIYKILENLYNPLIRAMTACPKPIICGLNGIAAGGAASLVLACDIIVARRSARLVSAFSRIGLVPDCGGSWFYPHAFGPYRAKAFAMLEDEISAEEAHSYGVISRLSDDADFDEMLEKTATSMANASPLSMKLIKQSINAAATNDLSMQLDLERDFQDKAARAPDFREGVAAFREKRKAVFG